jgi:hypothetical protein
MHGCDGFGEARVSKARQDAAFDQPLVHSGSQKQHKEVFNEAIHCCLTARMICEGFRKKHLNSRSQFWN